MISPTITNLVYPAYLLIAFSLTLIFIPRKIYKHYLLYGIILGGCGDFLIVSLYQDVFHLIQFKNQGIFLALGQHMLSPLSWIFTLMLFLYFLPQRTLSLFFYIPSFGLAATFFGYLVHNANLFDFKPGFYPIFAFLSFTFWWILSFWLYRKKILLDKDSSDKL